jgi:exodeoxyribonuclease VIII
MRPTGIYENVDIETYHDEEGISSSGINLILDCPKRYWHEYNVANPIAKLGDARKKNDKFKLGSAFHMLLLEPEKFDQNFFPMTEEVNLTTTIGKQKYAEADKAAGGRYVIRASEWQTIKEMAEAARTHQVWQHIKDGKAERSIYWDAGIYNTRLRARPDIYNDKLIIDVKTTDSIPGFQRTMYAYGYHRQAALQIDALRHFNEPGDNHQRFFAFFVVEKKAPYLTACFTLDQASLDQGRKEYQDGAATYSECLKANHWPGYDEKFQLATIPSWAVRKEIF